MIYPIGWATISLLRAGPGYRSSNEHV